MLAGRSYTYPELERLVQPKCQHQLSAFSKQTSVGALVLQVRFGGRLRQWRMLLSLWHALSSRPIALGACNIVVSTRCRGVSLLRALASCCVPRYLVANTRHASDSSSNANEARVWRLATASEGPQLNPPMPLCHSACRSPLPAPTTPTTRATSLRPPWFAQCASQLLSQPMLGPLQLQP